MPTNINLNKILFLDIETVWRVSNYDLLDEKSKFFWDKKCLYISEKEQKKSNQIFEEKAWIYAEFGKIVCISCGFWENSNFENIKTMSFFGNDEKKILTEFWDLIEKLSDDFFLCAHNGKEFDFPYISRRMVINQIKIPKKINQSGKKPRETSFLDTMEMRKFWDYKSYTSLDLIANVLWIDSPKDDIDWSQVHKVYRQDGDIDRIVKYCEKDIKTTAKIFLRYYQSF